jgi:hypothetical protein
VKFYQPHAAMQRIFAEWLFLPFERGKEKGLWPAPMKKGHKS